jgi:hypothetical protein
MATEQYAYDVCLSFAGEQREYVERVAAGLVAKNFKPFYDRYEQVTLWGKDLYEHLDEVYQKKARYCILFISTDYARKVWTSHERKSAQARAFAQSQEYILPARFDDTEIPGLRPTVGYIDISKMIADDLVELVCEKLADLDSNVLLTQANKSYVLKRVPLSLDEQQLLVATRPPAWEHLLFGGVLAQGSVALSPKKRDHKLGHINTPKSIPDHEVLIYIGDAMKRAARGITSRIVHVLDPDNQEWAFGPLGSPGNTENILHLGKRFIDAYESMYDWASELRSVVASSEFDRVFQLASHLMDLPMETTEHFIEGYANTLEGALDRMDRGEKGIEISLEFTISIDENLEEEFGRELDRLHRLYG